MGAPPPLARLAPLSPPKCAGQGYDTWVAVREELGSRALSNADLARVLSPLLFFAAHVVYLALWSPEPFLNKWIDGSFTFFVALVLCNIIRARVIAAAAGDEEGDAGAPEGPDDADSAAGAGSGGDGERHPPQ